MDCTTETPRKAGRPPSTVTLTRAELAAIMGMTPKGVSKRIERKQSLVAPSRYGLVKDVTNEPKRKPCDDEPKQKPVDPEKQQRQDIDAIMSRRNEPGNIMDERARLEMAWAMGHGCGARR